MNFNRAVAVTVLLFCFLLIIGTECRRGGRGGRRGGGRGRGWGGGSKRAPKSTIHYPSPPIYHTPTYSSSSYYSSPHHSSSYSSPLYLPPSQIHTSLHTFYGSDSSNNHLGFVDPNMWSSTSVHKTASVANTPPKGRSGTIGFEGVLHNLEPNHPVEVESPKHSLTLGNAELSGHSGQEQTGGVTVVNNVNHHHYHSPLTHTTYNVNHHHYYSPPTHTTYDTGRSALDVYLDHSLANRYYNHPKYDHYAVHHFYHDRDEVPKEATIQPDTIIACGEDTGSFCPANTTSLCTNNGTVMCVVKADSTVPCTTEEQTNCVKSSVPCENNNSTECKQASGESVSITMPCVSTAKVYGDISYVDDNIDFSNITAVSVSAGENGNVPSQKPQMFCVTVLAVPTEKKQAPPVEEKQPLAEEKEEPPTWGIPYINQLIRDTCSKNPMGASWCIDALRNEYLKLQ